MINCIIIDDEAEHVNYFSKAIKSIGSDIHILHSANSVLEGIPLVNNSKFDLLFLDVQMPPHTGFDLLKAVTNRNFEIVFTTSYDKYALDAIKFSALDYLLKPYSKEDLKLTIDKYRHRAAREYTTDKVDNLLHNVNPLNSRKKIGLSDRNGIAFYDIDDIVYCQAENVYTTIYFENGKSVVTSKPLKEYDLELDSFFFYRIHHSYLVNLKKVLNYIRGDGGQLKLSTGITLDVARNKKEGLLEKLHNI